MKTAIFFILSIFLSSGLLASTPSKYDVGYFTDAKKLNVFTRKQKIAVMVGLGLDHIIKMAPNILDPLIARQLKVIESKFEKAYGREGFELDVRFYPDRFSLWNVLNSPEYVALFWIGHGSQNGKIFDGDSFEITELFSSVHPNLRFLAIVGCYSEKGFAPFKKKISKANPALQILNFEDKIDMHSSIDAAIKKATPVLNRPSIKNGYACKEKKARGLHLAFKRVCSGVNFKNIGHFPAVTIATSYNNQIIAAFPPCMKEGEVQRTTGHVALRRQDFDGQGELVSTDKLNLVISSGERLVRNLDDFIKLDIGEFTVTHSGEEKWFGIIDPETGSSTKVDVENLTFSGEANLTQMITFNQHLCLDMPERK